jgi:hypothetical protein
MPTRIPMARCASPGQRRQSHDDEKSCPRSIDNDAGYDLRTCICGCGRIAHSGSARCGRPLGPVTATRLRRHLSGDADCRDQCAPLSWRAEVERLTSLPNRQIDIGKLISRGKRAGASHKWRRLGLSGPTNPGLTNGLPWSHGGSTGHQLSKTRIR